MRVIVVAAVGSNGVIGVRGDLPWRIPADLRRFRSLTMGSTLVMGRRTFESIGRPLPGRRTIVLTRQPDWRADGVTVTHSLDEALRLAGDADVFVVGGGEIYALALPLAQRLELTEVEQAPDGDTLFPAIEASAWVVAERRQQDGFAFTTYHRATPVAGSVAGRRAEPVTVRQPGEMDNDSIPAGPSTSDIPSDIPDDIPDDLPDLGGDAHPATGEIPNPETGVGIGAGQPSTFEPEETESEVGDPPAPPS